MKKRHVIYSLIVASIFGLYFVGVPSSALVNNGKPVAFAHRGVRNYKVENSEESYQLASKLGFKALEIDVCITKDNRPVIFHDDNCNRLLGIDTNIRDVEYSFIKDLPLLQNNRPTKNKVILLSDFFKILKKEQIVYVDVKKANTIIADTLLYWIKKTDAYNNTIVADDNLFFISYLKYKNKKIQTVLEGYNKGKEWVYYLIPNAFKPNYYASFLSEVDSNHIAFLIQHKLMKRKIVYGIDKTNLQQAMDYHLTNLIIDFDSSMINYTYLIKQIENNAFEKKQ